MDDHDVESTARDVHLYNSTVDSISWRSISVSVYDRSAKAQKPLLRSVDGEVRAGRSYERPRIDWDESHAPAPPAD